jgi:hypothetical protein
MSLEDVSPRGKEINNAAREKILKNADSYPAGLLEQYQIQLRRIEEQVPSCEFVSCPAFASTPNPPKPVRRFIHYVIDVHSSCITELQVHHHVQCP